MARKRIPAVREPVQVYLDAHDADLLSRLAAASGLPKTEVLRRGLRQLAVSYLTDREPGWSFDVLTSILGKDPHYPPDYAERHDHYLVQAYRRRKRVRTGAR
ncbi:MAG: ribbon-helix-helix protein, CopG family [Gemmatimonadales bacterium]